MRKIKLMSHCPFCQEKAQRPHIKHLNRAYLCGTVGDRESGIYHQSEKCHLRNKEDNQLSMF